MPINAANPNDIMLAAIAARDPQGIHKAAEQGANPAQNGHSLLLYAACVGRRDIIAPVFRATPDKEAAANSNALNAAIIRGHGDVLDYIVSTGLLAQRTLDDALQLAAANARADYAEILILAGANPRFETEPEMSALWFAIAAEDEPMLQLFHKHGFIKEKDLPRLRHYGFSQATALVETLILANHKSSTPSRQAMLAC